MSVFKNLTSLNKWIKEELPSVGVLGLSGSAQSYFFSMFLKNLQKPCLVILPSKKEAKKLYQELVFFMPEPDPQTDPENIRLHEFPPYDLSPLTGLSPHREIVTRRLQALNALIYDKTPIVITSMDAIFLRMLPKNEFVRHLEYLETGEEIERDSLIKKLETTGYQRASLVEERGDYSVRGGVIDLFPPLSPLPVRLEFWGDRLESIRQFDPLSQRSENHKNEIIILPANEIIKNQENVNRARSMGRLPDEGKDGAGFSGQEAWLNHFYPELDTLFKYLPADGLITLFDRHRLESAFTKTKEKFHEDAEKFRKEAADKGRPFPDIEGILVPFEEINAHIEDNQSVEFTELGLGSGIEHQKTIHFEGRFKFETDLVLRLATKGRISMAPLAEKISEWISTRSRVVLISRTEQQANRLKEILDNYEVAVERVVSSWDEIPNTPGLNICLGRLSKGFAWPDLGLYVISEDEIFGPKRGLSRAKRRAREKAITWSGFSQLRAGDFVVHDDHGIGRYAGLEKMEIAHRTNDYVIIEYAKKDRLYIPADRISVLQKYVGANERHPKLDQLGGRSWDIAKRKARTSVEKIARQLVEIYALRKYRKGYAFSPPDHYYREFEATFEHEETPDQTKAIEDVLDDMASDRPMDRLICGDVGFGKTEVAIRAAFKAVSDGKQVGLLVPTTVLAEQHTSTFKKRLGPYSIRIGTLSRFKSKSEQSKILGRLRSGELDVLIGTHRMLQKDVKFKDIGLLIIDEEQRFGVKQKEALKKFRSLVDVLAITATPIPRTLHMSLMGIRDLSIIETAPEDRLSIQSYLSPYDESLIIRALKSELERGGQIFFVHNTVRTIEAVTDQLRGLVPQARFAIAHGKMKEKELEKTMIRFLNREIDVLVCTTIIEAGLDIPSSNTIIINEVDRLGLAQVYQLRGRVGRSKDKAYAYLLLSNHSMLTRDAEKRLKALMEFSHLGAGLHLAMHDLKIRGGGNILGFAQAGQISAIGYELYLKLVEQAIAEIKGEEWHEDINPEINIDIPAYLPEAYVIDTDIRLNLYRRLSALREKSDLDAIAEEMNDRFGPQPHEVQNLLGIMSIRLVLIKLGITRLDVKRKSLTLSFSQEKKLDSKKMVQLANNHPKRFRFLSQYKLKMEIDGLSSLENFHEIETAVKRLPVY